MAITKESLVDKLNGDLAREYTAIVQYTQHSGVITGAAYGDIKKEIIIHAGEELQHALTPTDQIDYLGGEPTAKVLPANISDDNKEMLQQDLDGENEAIERYIERIGEAEEMKLLHLARS